jgi:hypothetical protein
MELVYWPGGRLDASHGHYRTSSPPGADARLFGTPIAFAITGFLHLLTDEDAGSLCSTAWASNPSTAPPASPTADSSHLPYRDRPFAQS